MKKASDPATNVPMPLFNPLHKVAPKIFFFISLCFVCVRMEREGLKLDTSSELKHDDDGHDGPDGILANAFEEGLQQVEQRNKCERKPYF